MIKLQDIKFNNYVELEPIIPMYYRGTVPIITVPDGAAKLKSGEGFDFLTYFNSLPIEKWQKYTSAENFYLAIEAVGRFDLDIVGHLPKENNHQKEWGGRFSYNLENRQAILIPIPKTMRSDVVSFGIIVHDDTYVYNAYYAADEDVKALKEPDISIVFNVTKEGRSIYKNIEMLECDVLSDDNYKNHFRLVIIDKDELLDKDSLPGNIDVIQNEKEFKKPEGAEGYVLVADETDAFFFDSFKRLYNFLRLLKDSYTGYEITGAIFEEERPNKQVDVYIEKDAKKDSFVATMARLSYMDLGIWSSVIDNEGEPEENIFRPGLFYCVPADRFETDMLLNPKDTTGTGYTLLRPRESAIFISGICAWVPKIKERLEHSRVDNLQKKLLKLQDIVFNGDIEIEITKDMYYRSTGKILSEKDGETKNNLHTFTDDEFFDFFTYFNAFSLEKWEKYTHVDNVYLILEAKGNFQIQLFGHYKSKVGFQKEWLGNYSYELRDKELLIIPYPRGMQSSLISFQIQTYDELQLYDAYYAAEIDKKMIKAPLISMVTTTFKKERFIERNIALLSDKLIEDPEYKKHFYWYIIDNGCTVERPEGLDKRIKIIPNKNVGGAGGFAKGQIESVRGDKKTTHILFMDDDVVFIPDSFKRLCNFLKVLKDEYRDYFISGAMLKTGQPNIQHESTGWLNDFGNNESINTNFDLNLWDAIINNEEIKDNIPNRYAAFWFCCVPTTVATLDNLPLPVFFRGDDIEYSLRNQAKLITMNGFCIWHEGFEGRFSASLDFYLTVRNKLMLCAINPHLNDIDMIGNIEENFWEEMRKYDYKGASFFLDAVEDFLKGPDFYKKTDGEANMKEKKALDNKLKPINPQIRGKIDFEKLYHAEPLSERDYEKYELTYNLQDTGEAKSASASGNVNEKILGEQYTSTGVLNKKKTGVIPYGWGTWPSKVYKMDEVIAVDPANDSYVIYKKDKKEFKRLKDRFEKLMKEYKKSGDKIIKKYQDSREELANEKFWDKYLG